MSPQVTDPAITRVRISVFATDPSTGAGPSGSYLVGQRVADHAIAGADQDRDGTTDLVLVTGPASSGVQFLDPLAGAELPGGFGLSLLTGGVAHDAY